MNQIISTLLSLCFSEHANVAPGIEFCSANSSDMKVFSIALRHPPCFETKLFSLRSGLYRVYFRRKSSL